MADDANSGKEVAQSFEFVDWGPPPDMRQRELIFDSLQKIVHNKGGKHQRGHGGAGGNDQRGTFVFTWGAGYHGQLGRKFVRGQKKYSAVPLLIHMDVVVRQVVCGGLHTALVTEDGKVYTWGEGVYGQLGHIHDPSLKQTPREVDMHNVFVKYVACGRAHTVAIADSGALYSWGWTKFGQTGHGERSNYIKTPKRVDHPLAKQIVAVDCGDKHTVAITRNGVALAWGGGEHGQTGHGDPKGDENKIQPVLIPAPVEALSDKNIVSIACGAIHSAFVAKDGELYVCGFGEHIYPNETQHFMYSPKHIELPEPVQQVACGQSHIIALSKAGNVYGWGSGERGQIGFGMKGNLSTPRLVMDNGNVAQVAAGRYHSFALDRAGILYSWGCGENGQLGQNSDDNIYLPSVATPILGTVVGQVSCGEHHTAVLTSAPWTKYSQDIHEWLHEARVEHDYKVQYLKRTNRGLTKKDLHKLQEQMDVWREKHRQRQAVVGEEEAADLKKDIESIASKGELRRAIRQQLADAPADVVVDAHGTQRILNLPSVEGGSAAMTAGPGKGGRLPKIDAGGDLSRTAPVDGQQQQAQQQQQHAMAATQVAQHQHQQQQQQQQDELFAGTSGPVPLARAAFLKETAMMVRRMTQVVQEKGEATTSKELEKMLRLVFAMRKEYDSLKHHARGLQGKLTALKKELALMNNSQAGAREHNERRNARYKQLEMELSTVQIKIAEVSENRKNYELNISHLKEEDFEHFNQLAALRKQCSENNSFFKKMDELKIQAVEEKERAEAELAEFRKEIASYQRFVHSQLEQFESILAIVRGQNEKRELARSLRTEKSRVKIAERVERLTEAAKAADKNSAGLQDRLTSLDLKLRHFEDSFQKISAATGLTQPDAIVNKFFFKGEIKEQLEQEIDDKQQRIKEARQREQALQQQLADLKANYREKRWRDVEEVADAMQAQTSSTVQAQQTVVKTTRRMAMVEEGLLSLLREIEIRSGVPMQRDLGADLAASSSSNGQFQLWSPDDAATVFNRLSVLMQDLLEKAEVAKSKRRAREANKKKQEEEKTSHVLSAFGVMAAKPAPSSSGSQ